MIRMWKSSEAAISGWSGAFLVEKERIMKRIGAFV